MKDINFFVNITNEILKKDLSQYLINKRLITYYFRNTKIDINTLNKQDILKIRLILIDSLYSTQMSTNPKGIDEISNKLIKFSDNELSEMSKQFLIYSEENITELLSCTYGKKRAPSLISKYLYFLTNYNFPIYDNLVKKEIHYKKLDILEYFIQITKIKNHLKLNYDDLDKILWVKGKIKFNKYLQNSRETVRFLEHSKDLDKMMFWDKYENRK